MSRFFCILVSIAALFACFAKAQSLPKDSTTAVTVRYLKDWYKTDPIMTDSGLIIKEYYEGNLLKAIGHCKNGKLHGKYYGFDEQGRIIRCASYKNGKLNGEVFNYYPSNGKVHERYLYKNDITNGRFIAYDSVHSLPTTTGVFKKGKPSGTQIMYFVGTKKLMSRVKIKRSKMNGVFRSYYPNGTKKRVEKFYDSKSLGGKCYDENGKEIPFYPYIEGGKLIGDFVAYVKSNIQYPPDVLNHKVKGVVKVCATANEQGNVSDILIIRSLTPECDAETIRLVKELKFTPERADGDSFTSLHYLTVKFEY